MGFSSLDTWVSNFVNLGWGDICDFTMEPHFNQQNLSNYNLQLEFKFLRFYFMCNSKDIE